MGRQLLLMTLCGALIGCPSEEAKGPQTHRTDEVEFQLPPIWRPVPDRRGLFAPEGEHPDKTNIQIRSGRNLRRDSGDIRAMWVKRRERGKLEGRLLDSSFSTLNGFDAFSLVFRSPAPSAEEIPLEHQIAGDQIYHTVELIDAEHVYVSARLLDEETSYEARRALFEQVLASIRPLSEKP